MNEEVLRYRQALLQAGRDEADARDTVKLKRLTAVGYALMGLALVASFACIFFSNGLGPALPFFRAAAVGFGAAWLLCSLERARVALRRANRAARLL